MTSRSKILKTTIAEGDLLQGTDPIVEARKIYEGKPPLFSSAWFHRRRVYRAFRILRKSIPRACYSRAERKRKGREISKMFLHSLDK